MTKQEILNNLKNSASAINKRGFSSQLTSEQQMFLHNLAMEINKLHDKLDNYNNNPDDYSQEY